MRNNSKTIPATIILILIAAAFYSFSAIAEKICHRLSLEMTTMGSDDNQMMIIGNNCVSNSEAAISSEVCQSVYGYAKLNGWWSESCTCERLSPTYAKLIFYPAKNPTQDTTECPFTPGLLVAARDCQKAVKNYFGIE
ncbi:MAG: hypothetical protein LBT45_03850 [Rickettsiales bacterium]|jgi:hypothetical protein|nr:hypothetical protein [Rickettsiales bacterium]